MSFDLGKLFIEWRRIVPNGVPNPGNDYHLVLLKEICLAKGIDRQIVDNVILALEKVNPDTKITYKIKDPEGNEKDMETTYDKAIKRDKEHPAYKAAKALQDKEGGKGDEEEDKPEPMKIDPEGGLGKKDDSDTETQSQEEKRNQTIERANEVSKKLYGEDGNGPLLQDSETSQQALDKGYKKGEPWVAPGNAGSNFNENMSDEGCLILEQEEDLTEDELAEVLFNRVKDTELGKQQKDTVVESPHNKDKGNVPKDLDKKEKEIYKCCIIAARSAKEKRDRAKRGQEAVGMENAKIKTFGGTASDLNNLKEEIRKAKRIVIYDEETGQVVEIPQEVLLEWVDSSGGGENAADTAVLSVDENGNLLYDGWSDKKAFSDIQGNSTLNDDYNKQESNVNNLLEDDRVDEGTAEQAIGIIKDAREKSAEIEQNYKKAPLKEAQYFATYQGEDKQRLVQHLKDQDKDYQNAGTENHVQKAMSFYGVNTYEELLDALIEEAENGKPSGNRLKVINRAADSERAYLKERDGEIPSTLDTKQILSDAREAALSLQRETVDKLNNLKGKTKSGKEKPLGDMLGFQETIDFLHLDKIEEPKDENDHNAYLKRNTHLVMGGVNVPPKSIKECLGVNDLGDAEDNFEVVTDERLIKDRDEKKYTTGKVVYIYAINKGERKFIGVKSFRPKQGQTSKTNNDIKWSKEMQDCFDSKRDK